MRLFISTIKAGLIPGLLLAFSPQAFAFQINTADESSAYHKKFCPPLKKALKKAQFKYKCIATDGSINNIKLVGEDARQLGFAQQDLFALEKTMQGGKKIFHTLRDDIAKVCLFMVSKNKNLQSYGQVAANADSYKFVLPPLKSNHAGTFQYLQQIDPKGLGLAKNITHVASTDEAIKTVLESEDNNLVTMFVQFPDANNVRFKNIIKKKGQFIPVIDRNILRQDINGEKIYFAEDTKIANPNWVKKGESVVTSCTPIVLFTGTSKLVKDETEKKDHVDLIKTVEALPLNDLQPKKGFLSAIWNKTKSLSATSVETMVKASDQARKAARPMVHKAREIGSQTIEASKPVIKKAAEVGSQAITKAGELAVKVKDKAKEMIKEEEE